MRSHARIPWSTLVFALLGLFWCGFVAFPTANPPPCLTSGCALFRDGRVAGLSLWWVGGAHFFLLTILCLRGNRILARGLAMVALFVDALLLVVMFLTAPCFDCLVVAALMGCCYFTLRRQPASDGWFTEETAPSLLLPVWFGLFLGNSALALNEQMPLYALGNTKSTDVSVYFSPSCPACREAILSLGNSAALYPVEEKEEDVDSILRLGSLLKRNVPLREALPRSLDKEEPVPYIPFYERALLSLHLLRNKASLLRQGFRAVPLIRINGMPGQATTPLDRAMQRQEPGRLSNPSASAASGQSADPIYPLAPSFFGPGASGQAPGEGVPGAFSTPRSELPSGTGVMGERGLPDFLKEPEDLSRCGGADAPPCR